MSKKKSEILLRRIIIGAFVFFTIAAIVFAMSVDAPMLPSEKQPSYVLEENGVRISCLFPIANFCNENDKNSE